MTSAHPPPRDLGPRLSLPAVRAIPALLAASLILSPTSMSAAYAQDGWNPFIENNGLSRPPRREGRPGDAEPARPFLAPMTGPRPREEPSNATAPEGGLWPEDGRPLQQAGQQQPAPQPPGLARPSGGREVIERTDLAPLTGPQDTPPAAPSTKPRVHPALAASGTGTDAAAAERLLQGLDFPSRSPALTALMLRLVSPGRDSLLGNETPDVLALKAGALYRGGRTGEASTLLEGGKSTGSPLLTAHAARIALALGDRDGACALAQTAAAARTELPPPARAEMLMMQGYCAAAQGNAPAAGLAAALLREEGAQSPAALRPETLAALDAIAVGEPPRLAGAKRVGVLDWRLAELAQARDGAGLSSDAAEPALLAALATSPTVDPRLRIAAAEAAARLNVIEPQALAAAYRQHPATSIELSQALTVQGDAASRRAVLFRAAEAERTPLKRTRLIRSALDDARRAGLYVQLAATLAPAVSELQPVAEIGWFAETAVEVMIAAARFDLARSWLQFAGQPGAVPDRAPGGLSHGQNHGLTHWAALIDIADSAPATARGTSLSSVEELVLRGRFTGDALHRLATVLDALDYDVPLRLWEAASRTAQPSTGFLPPTGALAELQDAARQKDLVRCVPLAMRTLGPAGPEGAHIIALGDTIRALKRAGLEPEARAIALEALFALWPRGGSA